MRSSLFVAAAVLLAACRSVDSATFADRDPRPADAEVRVFRSQQPACRFEEVGMVTWTPMTGLASLDDGVRAMRERAREMGGDAIIDFTYGVHSTGTSTSVSGDSSSVQATSSVVTEERASGTVVRYLEDGCEA